MTLRSFGPDDADRVLEILGDDGLAMLAPSSLDTARVWIDSHNSSLNCVCAICDGENAILGAVALALQKNPKHAEISFWIDTVHQGKGHCIPSCSGDIGSWVQRPFTSPNLR